VSRLIVLRRVKPTREGLLPRTAAADYLDVRVTLGTVDRAMRILDAFLKAMDARGFSISIDVKEQNAVTRAHVLDVIVLFHIEERVEYVATLPPAPKRLGEWVPQPETKPVGSGALEFYIDAYFSRTQADVRKSWRDGTQQRVEDCLGKILVGFVAAAAAIKADRLAHEEWERRGTTCSASTRIARWPSTTRQRPCMKPLAFTSCAS
jgi:hypothetical protein